MADKDDYYNKSMDNVSEKGLRIFLYNNRTGQICGRTCSSWCKITIFYIIFYLCLSAFWTIMLVIFYQTLELEEPKWKLDGSRIGNVPGLGFRPQPPEETIDSTLIWFKHGGHDTKKMYWVENLKEYLEAYSEQTSAGEHVEICTPGQAQKPKRVCQFPVDKIPDPCNYQNQFGFDIGHPCILIKINRLFDWEPEGYDPGSFPENIPTNITDNYDPDNIYISCEGENAADRENMGPVSYFPTNSIPNYYFPFRNYKGYLSPFVFVHFMKPNFGVLINIECKAWAKNIIHDRMERKGSVHFELLVD